MSGTEETEGCGPRRRLRVPYVFGASVAGPLHVKTGIPCQDACAFHVLGPGYAIIAAADGLGSAPRSDGGARIVVRSAVQTAAELLSTQPGTFSPLSDIVRVAVIAARRALEEEARHGGYEVRALACTVIVVAAHEKRISVAHVGDGAVVAKKPHGLELVSDPGDSEYLNEVTPLTSTQWETALRTVTETSEVSGVAVFTDGLQRACLSRTERGLAPFERFFEPVFSYAQEIESLAEAESELKQLLSSGKLASHSEDDKTLVLGVLE